jgi:hypothetical protein
MVTLIDVIFIMIFIWCFFSSTKHDETEYSHGLSEFRLVLCGACGFCSLSSTIDRARLMPAMRIIPTELEAHHKSALSILPAITSA